jgi:hypothetical protein
MGAMILKPPDIYSDKEISFFCNHPHKLLQNKLLTRTESLLIWAANIPENTFGAQAHWSPLFNKIKQDILKLQFFLKNIFL